MAHVAPPSPTGPWLRLWMQLTAFSAFDSSQLSEAAHFKSKFRAETYRRGEPGKVICEAFGERPIKIDWLKDSQPLLFDPGRYLSPFLYLAISLWRRRLVQVEPSVRRAPSKSVGYSPARQQSSRAPSFSDLRASRHFLLLLPRPSNCSRTTPSPCRLDLWLQSCLIYTVLRGPRRIYTISFIPLFPS